MQYDKNRFKIYALPHPLVLLWVLFPGIMFVELMLGRRLPKVVLVDKENDERTFVPCPHCETLNDQRLWWAKGNALGHWFGLVCPRCHHVIPCLWNIFSLVILAITFPLWYFPVRFLRYRWIETEKERLAKVLERPLTQAKSITSALVLLVSAFASGVAMWGMWEVVEILWRGKEWDLKTMLKSLPVWLLAGFGGSVLGSWIQKDQERLANVPARPLTLLESIRWFIRGTFYFGGSLWVAFVVLPVLEGKEWDFMFDSLPSCLLVGCLCGAFMHVLDLVHLLDAPKSKKGRKT